MSRYGGDSWAAGAAHRRHKVAELMGDKAEGEVTRCSNGRYACTVCAHQPVFDTLPMFAIHQQGRKHQAVLAARRRATGHQDHSRKRPFAETQPSRPHRPLATAPSPFSAAPSPPAERQSRPPQPRDTAAAPASLPPAPDPHLFFAHPSAQPDFPRPTFPLTPYSSHHPASRFPQPLQQPNVHDDETLREQSKKRRMEQEYYDKLRELGWRRRADGSLEKDPDVEWDSDADESPPPPPPGIHIPPSHCPAGAHSP
ncbi:uncharacterized protein ACA1_296880 [Acanthamoeba castellanii str. Neff]|uniref:Sodium channel modifier 1 n=1 Tax=Acanthamoeba castellanii (strain ATCC 30010 / Neff) TaxID=1257118 RepID=L8HK39_ACACF|nr:uncharacterized protein ACA1_296880 [Acanthamoeba castellanii str. Neff]ELR25567.1 hypothetical protein ACA1_296880 [Acanthamoeba castellanii str. Neff]